MIYQDRLYDEKNPNGRVEYHRVTGPLRGTTIGTDDKNYKILRDDGIKIWELNKAAIMKFIEQTI